MIENIILGVVVALFLLVAYLHYKRGQTFAQIRAELKAEFDELFTHVSNTGAATAASAAATVTQATAATFASLTPTIGSSPGLNAVPAYDTPDEYGFAKLHGLAGVPYWGDFSYQVQEITKTLTGDQYGKALANLTEANGVWILGKFIAVGYYPVQQGTQWVIPQKSAQHPAGATVIPNTRSGPGDQAKKAQHPQTHLFYDLTTVAGLVEWLKVTAPPEPGPGASGPLV